MKTWLVLLRPILKGTLIFVALAAIGQHDPAAVPADRGIVGALALPIEQLDLGATS